jgi:hypothetical protein
MSEFNQDRGDHQPPGDSPATGLHPATPPASIPPPLRLHWGWVLGLSIVSYGAFLPIWLLVETLWVRRVKGRCKAFVWAIAHLCSLPFLFLAVVILAFMADSPQFGDTPQRIGSIVALGILLGMYFTTIYKLRAELLAEPFGLALNGPMSFLGGPVYLQARIREFGLAPASISLIRP